LLFSRSRDSGTSGTRDALLEHRNYAAEGVAMDLAIGLPVLLLLGLVVVGLMFLFVEACDKV
jgi:hypothetical protein